MSVRVVVDSTSYIPRSLRDELDMHVVSLAVVFPDGAQRELDVDDGEFYRRLSSEQKVPTSTQPTPAEMEEAFLAVLDQGHDVVGVFISSDMSGTFSSAELAARQIRETRPEAVIELVDSRSNSMQLGMAALSAARAARAGADAAMCVAAAHETMLRTRFLFTPHTLDYLRLGGRIGTASAFLGTMLQIRPILTVEHGITEAFDKVRTRRRALERIVEVFAQDVARCGFRQGFIHHIDDLAEGEGLAAMCEPVVGQSLPVVPIGPVIGLHVGPATVAVVYETEQPLRDSV